MWIESCWLILLYCQDIFLWTIFELFFSITKKIFFKHLPIKIPCMYLLMLFKCISFVSYNLRLSLCKLWCCNICCYLCPWASLNCHLVWYFFLLLMLFMWMLIKHAFKAIIFRYRIPTLFFFICLCDWFWSRFLLLNIPLDHIVKFILTVPFLW